MLPFFVTIPHSGEQVPDLCTWLQKLPETLLMADVDRYVDRLYEPSLKARQIPFIKTEWHRYAADLNRVPADVDADAVIGSQNPSGKFPNGFHWVITKNRDRILPAPISLEVHQKLVQLIYEPFHQSVRNLYQKMHDQGEKEIFHLDAHSMPSLGTSEHRDPGERRADIVVSDSLGKSARADYVDLVITSYTRAGFKVGYNWPYYGGRVTEQYGEPAKGHHCLQVELNRALYMNEQTKQINALDSEKIQKKIDWALSRIAEGVAKLIK